MNTHNTNKTRQLDLSHTVYHDNEIDADKAKKLVVYHYPLPKSYKWKEWQNHLDQSLSDQYYPYLMRSHKGQFGLFVAVDTIENQPPIIKNADGIIIHPTRVRYTNRMNPVWIRLIMRKMIAFGSHCKGSHSLGRPLLKIDQWRGKNGAGINAISLDCRTQQYKDKNETEIVFFHENVPLRPLADDVNPHTVKSSLWIYDKKNILVRWLPTKGKAATSVVYREIRKNKNKRKQRAFIDLSSAKAFAGSWPVILKPIQDELIQQAAHYGFFLRPRTLNLQPLAHYTKYKPSSLNGKKKALITSLPLDHTIHVLDLRVSTTLTGSAIVNIIQEQLDKKELGTTLELLPPCKPEDIASLSFDADQRVLILLDQRPKVINDRYLLTRCLRANVACQHLNVNPHDLANDEPEKYVTEEEIAKGKTIGFPKPAYYIYDEADFTDDTIKANLHRNTEIVVKEVHLKHLLLSPTATISTSLPEQAKVLTDDLVVITAGYLFTVRDNRPLFFPFNPSHQQQTANCNRILKNHNTSINELLDLMRNEWPYNYKPDIIMQGFGNQAEKMTRFARRLTIVIRGKKNPAIFFQDPRYDTPHMLPSNLDKARELLNAPTLSKPTASWKLPDYQTLLEHIHILRKEGTLLPTRSEKLIENLLDWTEYWEQARQQLIKDNKLKTNYKQIKKQFNESYRTAVRIKKGLKETERVHISTHLISSWEKLLSHVFDLTLNNPRTWLGEIPGIQKLWHDPDKGYYIVGQLTPPKLKITRQPSIRQWHALQGRMDTQFLTSLIDVDWVRVNQLAGNPCVATLVKRWQECQVMDT